MRILLTNDDGILAEGIYALYLELKKIADVTVVAPDSERSSIGHAITLAHPISYRKFHRENKFFGYGVSGTPADCVKIAVSVIMKQKPDIVVSGINFGCNDGCSVIYSGTVAGAREGALLGFPAMAVSLATFENPDFSYAAKCSARLVKVFAKQGMPHQTFLNVNVPAVKASQIKGIKVTRQGLEPIHATFSKRKSPHDKEYFWMSGKMPSKMTNDSFDTNALAKNYVTVTPILSDTTNYPYYEELKSVTL